MVNSPMAGPCPAFSGGCPYSKDNKMVEWLSAQKGSISCCPAFQSGCPFNSAQDMQALARVLQGLPPSHAEGAEAAAHNTLVSMLQEMHQASQRVKAQVGGDCPVFQQSCPFKACTASGRPLVQELEVRTWGLIIGAEEVEGEVALDEAAPRDEGLACLLKQGTAESHKAAENVHFVREFIKGKVPRDLYAQFIVDLLHIYTALEEALELCADHDLVEPLYFPEELNRAEALRRDVEYLCGADWQQQRQPSPVTEEYAARIRELASSAPELLVPHAYTRYLGDLSGGQVLRRAAVRGLGLPADGSGVQFYIFKRVRDPKAFKDMYRARLDALPTSGACADAMVEEANRAFDYNTRIFKELDALGGFVADEAPPMLAETLAKPAVPAPASVAACPFAALAASGVPMPMDHPPLPQSQPANPKVVKAEPKAQLAKAEPQAKARMAALVAVLALLLGLLSRLLA